MHGVFPESEWAAANGGQTNTGGRVPQKRIEASAEYIRQLLSKSPMPRNQVAAISGLTNTYICDLEKGIIANVARTKLISLAVALNLNLVETDQMLNVFDRAALTRDDIPIFLETTEKRHISSALLPVRDRYSLDLMMLSAEKIPGEHVLVSSEPTVCLRAEGHRKYSERRMAAAHPIYDELVETIGRERRAALERNLEEHLFTQYICPSCLEDYIRRCQDDIERGWRLKHIENVIEFLERFSNWHFYFINTCPTFNFVLKTPAPKTGENEKLLITRLAPHRFQGKRSGKLTGFTTDNQVVIQNFKEEINGIKNVVIPEYRDRKKTVAFLKKLISG